MPIVKSYTKSALMKMTKAKLVSYVVVAVRNLTKDRNWNSEELRKYRGLYAALVKEDRDSVSRKDYDDLRAMNTHQSKQINDLLRRASALQRALKEVL